MARLLVAVAVETVPLTQARGRVVASPLRADRDSPALDVSAMDGYAVRLADARARGRLHVANHARIGQPPVTLPPGAAAGIVTGAPIPLGAEAVLPRESVIENGASIDLPGDTVVHAGQYIRRRGDNAVAGAIVIEAGVALHAAALGACATFGLVNVPVHRRVRVALVITGDEVRHAGDAPGPWQLRDSNGPALAAMLDAVPWIELAGAAHAPDDLDATVEAIASAAAVADVVLMTGGVSMGDRDFGPRALARIDARTVFHGLPIRPGKPMLGAIRGDGKAILGLPGNPVSVLVTARRFASIVLRRLAGFAQPDAPASCVTMEAVETPHPSLWLYRPVRLLSTGMASMLPTQGSGDVAAAGGSDGVVELAPHAAGERALPFYPWDAW